MSYSRFIDSDHRLPDAIKVGLENRRLNDWQKTFPLAMLA
jgi:hypothetical protein